MTPIENKILVRVDTSQKDYTLLGGKPFQTAKRYENNKRIACPVIAFVVSGNEHLKCGEAILCHHNLFVENSPYFYEKDLYGIKATNETIFLKLDKNGYPHPVYGNIIAEWVQKQSVIELPGESTKPKVDRYICLTDGYGYRKGQIIFTIPYSGYEIVYIYDGEERRAIKVSKDDIIAFI